MRNASKRQAFSLLELVAVVTMVGIVAAVTMFRLHNVSDQAARSSLVAHQTTLIQDAVDRYRFNNGSLPTNIKALVAGKYLSSFPKTPDATGSYSIDPTTGVVSYSSGP